MSVLVCTPELTEYVAACKNAGQVCHLALVIDTRLQCVLASPFVCRGSCVLLLRLLLLQCPSSGSSPFLVCFVLFSNMMMVQGETRTRCCGVKASIRTSSPMALG